ncbi:hypothetical protein SRHO_G00258250 [Serrasalmus rhombeus]
MGVNSTFSSLTITAVTPSDSGLYYCSTQKEQFMTFSTTTRLQIRESCSPPKLFHLLTLMLGAVIAVLLSALLILTFTRQTDRKEQRDGLYYCFIQKEQFMTFSTTTRLQIRAGCTVNVVLTLLFGAVIAVLLSALLILIFTRQADRKEQRDGKVLYV